MLFNLAAKMVRMSPDLKSNLVIRDTAKQIFCPDLGTLYKALSAEASTAHGQSPIFAVHDELGQVRGPVTAAYLSKASITYTPYDENSKLFLIVGGVINPTSQPGNVDYNVRIRRDGVSDIYPAKRFARSVANTFPAVPFTVVSLDGGLTGSHTWSVDMAATANATGGADPATYDGLVFALLELKR